MQVRKVVSLLVAMVLALGMSVTAWAEGDAAAIEINETGVTVHVGETVTFSATVKDADDNELYGQDLIWELSGGVSGGTSIDGGSGVLSVASDETAASLIVTVMVASDETVTNSTTVNVTAPVSGVTVTGAGGAAAITSNGGTLQMYAQVTPTNVRDDTVTWSVQNGTGAADISAGGLLSAVSNGTVTVKATANDGSGVYGVLEITISNQETAAEAPSFISNLGSAETAEVGDTITLSVTLNPVTDGGTLSYQWKKDGANIGADSDTFTITDASLNDSGNYCVIVTNAKAGNIPASVTSATCALTVSPKAVELTGVSQAGGVSNTATTTSLTLSFSAPIKLSPSNITLGGAVKGALTGSGSTWHLAISGITVDDGESLTVTVSAPVGYTLSGSPKTVEVYKSAHQPSDNALLAGLSISSGALSPVFAPDTASYTARVDNSEASITVTPTVQATGLASVKVDGKSVADGTDSGAIGLAAGSTKRIPVVVTAESGAVKTYTIDVTREAAAVVIPPSYDNDSGNDRDSYRDSGSGIPAAASVSAAEANAAARSAAESAKLSGASAAYVNLRNPGEISLDALKAMSSASGMPITLSADNLNASGTAVEVRVTLDPSLATRELSLSASTTNSSARLARSTFETYFDNNISVVSLEQKGSFGQPVEIAAKVGEGLNINSLVFYIYDKATNTYTRNTSAGYWVDKNGYVHFYTTFSGDIIITDKPLTAK